MTCAERRFESLQRLLRQPVDQVHVDRAESVLPAGGDRTAFCSTLWMRLTARCTVRIEILDADRERLKPSARAARSGPGPAARIDLDRVLSVRLQVERLRAAGRRAAPSPRGDRKVGVPPPQCIRDTLRSPRSARGDSSISRSSCARSDARGACPSSRSCCTRSRSTACRRTGCARKGRAGATAALVALAEIVPVGAVVERLDKAIAVGYDV
jgi:hypothetical protein